MLMVMVMVMVMKLSRMAAMRNRSSGVEDAISICKARARYRDAPQPKPGCDRAGIVRRWHWVMEGPGGSGSGRRVMGGQSRDGTTMDSSFSSTWDGTVQQRATWTCALGAVCGRLDPSSCSWTLCLLLVTSSGSCSSAAGC